MLEKDGKKVTLTRDTNGRYHAVAGGPEVPINFTGYGKGRTGIQY
ncbi:MAG: hypothetical protein ACOH2V_01260 [Candidatus Saccharimonadaceae bacterium]